MYVFIITMTLQSPENYDIIKMRIILRERNKFVIAKLIFAHETFKIFH